MHRTLICAALLGVCLAAHARQDKGKDKADDQAFVNKAVESDLAEINLSRIAAKNAKAESVKKFARQMIEDHTKTSKELTDLINKKRLRGPSRMDAEHDKMAKKLSSLSGAAFDKEYMAGQVKDHEAAVALFEKQSEGGSDKDLTAWAKKTLPHLRMHLKMAKEIDGELRGEKKKDGGKDKHSDKEGH